MGGTEELGSLPAQNPACSLQSSTTDQAPFRKETLMTSLKVWLRKHGKSSHPCSNYDQIFPEYAKADCQGAVIVKQQM